MQATDVVNKASQGSLNFLYIQFVFMKGALAPGKSIFIQKNNLTLYVVSPDDIRLYFGGLQSDLYGIISSIKTTILKYGNLSMKFQVTRFIDETSLS